MVTIGKDETEDALEKMAHGRVREVMHEVAGERFNEAALVARRNPELEDYSKRSAGENMEDDTTPPMDSALQRAVHAVQAREMLGRSKLYWKVPAADGSVKEEILKVPKTLQRWRRRVW